MLPGHRHRGRAERSDGGRDVDELEFPIQAGGDRRYPFARGELARIGGVENPAVRGLRPVERAQDEFGGVGGRAAGGDAKPARLHDPSLAPVEDTLDDRSEEHTSELQSLMRISYAVFCLKKKK